MARQDMSWHVSPTEISLLEISTLEGARLLNELRQSSAKTGRIGILNFASAKKPGGGFLAGSQAQEESIARSSTLYPTFMTSTAQKYYTLHNRNLKGGYYSHAMIYSPDVLLIRDDDGNWTAPVEVDVLTSPAVNAGVVRKTLHGREAGSGEEDMTEKEMEERTEVEDMIEKEMKERMARILFLFEQRDVRNVVLGSFGTGVYQNKVGTVAKIWRDLLVVEGARFKDTFDRVVFAILGRETFVEFKGMFEKQPSSDEVPSS